VDPGTHRTGAGLIEAEGSRYRFLYSEILSLKSELSGPQKLHSIYKFLKQILERFRPQILALENIFYSKDVRAMVKIGEARACAILAASELGISVVEYAPARIKQAVSGNGRATKEQMQHMVKTLLNLKDLPSPDAADALAVAICHWHSKNKITDFLEKAENLKNVPLSYRPVG
jgi:crossover junction endodeoxyribonuclease RuvC